MKATHKVLVLLLLLQACSLVSVAQISPAKSILQRMIASVDAHNQYIYEVKSEERINNELVASTALFKYQYKPRKIYMRTSKPKEGVEILFGEGMYGGNALINTNGFPFFNIQLDPEGWIMRDDHHHSLHDAGFHFICRVLEHSMKKVENNFDDYFKFKGDTSINDKRYLKVLIDVFDFKYLPYTVKENETILEIADRLFLNDYLIVDKNPDVDAFDDVSPGQVIQLPSAFARKIIIYIDAITYFPFIEEIHDEKGVYERYTFRKIQASPGLSDVDFDENNDAYGF